MEEWPIGNPLLYGIGEIKPELLDRAEVSLPHTVTSNLKAKYEACMAQKPLAELSEEDMRQTPEIVGPLSEIFEFEQESKNALSDVKE